MAGLTSKVSPLLTKSAGSVTAATAQIRSMQEFKGDAIAGAMDDLQDQINQIVRAATQNQSLLNLVVTSKLGVLIGWVGTQVVNSVVYMGAWFREMRIGGTSAADAKIVADANGDVHINGATLTLTANGVQTTIQNTTDATYGTESLKSLELATGFYSIVTPHWFVLNDAANNYAFMSSAGNQGGQITLTKPSTGAYVIVSTVGGGSPQVQVGTGGGITITITPLSGLLINGVSVIDMSKNASLANLAITGTFSGTHAQNLGTGDSPTFVLVSAGAVSVSGGVSANGFTASGAAGISTSGARVTSVSSALGSYLTSVSVSTSTISYTPGATTATFVDGVGSSSSNAVSAMSSSSVTDGYTDGLRTS